MSQLVAIILIYEVQALLCTYMMFMTAMKSDYGNILVTSSIHINWNSLIIEPQCHLMDLFEGGLQLLGPFCNWSFPPPQDIYGLISATKIRASAKALILKKSQADSQAAVPSVSQF